MLKAQWGSPAGTVSSCAFTCRTMRSGARAHTRTAMRTDVLARRFRWITADLLSHFRREGNDVDQEPQGPPGRSGASLSWNASRGFVARPAQMPGVAARCYAAACE